EVEHMQLGLVQLVDHEPDDLVFVLGDHADAVPLPQAAEEVVLGPGEVEAAVLGAQNLRHVSPDHPADVHANPVLRRRTTRAHATDSSSCGATRSQRSTLAPSV